MNYFEHHIGDYDSATAHLSWLEDCAYRRLICLYYRTEAPIPADLKQVFRLLRASSKQEREAVQQVLGEFFVEREDGWHQLRCDREIARYTAGEPEREVKKANEDNRLKRHREERAALFKRLTDAGQHAPWNIGMNELRALVKALQPAEPETPLQPLPATAPATPATATQYPLPTTQPPLPNTENPERATATTVARPPPDVDPPEVNGLPPTLAGSVCRAMRAKGLTSVNPGDPRLLALLAQGIAEAEFVAVATEAVDKGKGWPWVLKVVQCRRQDAAAIAATPAPAAPVVSPTAWADSRDGVVNRACQLGLDAYDPTAAHYGTGPTWAQYRASVIAADKAATGATA